VQLDLRHDQRRHVRQARALLLREFARERVDDAKAPERVARLEHQRRARVEADVRRAQD